MLDRPVALKIRPDGIPGGLKLLPHWAVWSYEYNRDLEKWDKPPYAGASSTDPKTWRTFDDAYGLYLQLNADGLYIAHSEDRPMTGGDFDDCINGGSIRPDVEKRVQKLNTYTEKSPSGCGLRTVNWGSKPGSKCRTTVDGAEYELYDHGRWLSITGHHVDGYPDTINDDPEAVTVVYKEIFGDNGNKPAIKRTLVKRPECCSVDVITKASAAKDGAKFKRLFYDGDTSEYDFDDSRADAGLCSILRFWTQDDTARIDELFRNSALMRPKWDRKTGDSTYGEITIQKVIELGGDVYEGSDRETTKTKKPEQEPSETARDDIRYARATAMLKEEDPHAFILTTFSTLHVGDRDIGEGILLATAAQSVMNSRGVPSKLTGDSGMGKSDAAKKMMHLLPQEYVVYASLTDKAIWYHPNLKQGATIFSDDVLISTELEAIIKRSSSNFQRKTERILPMKDGKGNYIGVTQEVPARLNWLLTSVRSQGTDELIKRQMGYDVDTSPYQDKAYIEFEKKQSEKAIEELPITEDVLTCREILRILKENEDGTPRTIGVDIPFSSRIEWTDTENRRNFNIFMDMVRSFAMLRFMQRDRSEDGNIIATEEDFNDAKRHYGARAGMQALHLDETQKKFCQHIADIGGEADTPTMQSRMKKSRRRIYEIADGIESVYWRFTSEVRKVPVGDSETNTTNRRFYELNFDTREGFILDEYSTVVYLKPEQVPKDE